MVFAFGVTLQLRRVEINFSQIAFAVSLCLIVKVRRRGIAALATRGHGDGFNRLAKLDHGDKAVATGAVNFLGSFVRPRAEGSQRTPNRRSKSHRNARPGVGKGMLDVIGQPLKSIYLAPWCLPFAKVG